MNKKFEKEYHQTEKEHFWFKARRAYILDLISKSSRDLNIIDIGCSSGILLSELKAIGFKDHNLYGVDISEEAIVQCKSNGIANAYMMDAQHIELNKKFDIVIASDCLEHIFDDEKALQSWHNLLKPGGTIYVFTPAYMRLWSNHDVVNMHYRRYKNKELKAKLIKAGFTIKKSSYWNFFLFIPIASIRLIFKLIPKSKKHNSGDLNRIPFGNNILFQLINFENKLLKYINFPFGVSTFCIAKK